MKKYVHVWFVILAILLSTVLSTTVQAKTHGYKKHHHKHYTAHQKKKRDSYLAKHRKYEEKFKEERRLKEPDSVETLIANDYRESKVIQHGKASWYGPGFYGRKTASGEIFRKNELTAAHRTLPLGTKLRVTNNETGESVIVKVNDRGPFHGNRVIDLSHAAANRLGIIESGTCSVKIEKII